MDSSWLKEQDQMRHENPMIMAEIHRQNLNILRGRLGSKCSYLSFTRHNDDYGMKAVINGKTIDVAIGGEPHHIEDSTYEELYKQLDGYDKDK